MGLRQKRPAIIMAWARTLGALKEEGAVVKARCSRCDQNTRVDLDRLIEEKGALFCLWNKHPPCTAEGCTDRVTFQASRPGSGVWPLHLTEADPGQVDVIDAAWRASRINSAMGGQLALQLVVSCIRVMTRYGIFNAEERRALIKDAVSVIPDAEQADAAWLLEYYLALNEPRPGWR